MVVRLQHPTTRARVTLIGTAHLSLSSNRQVDALIRSERPDAVMVEVDASRLERLGLAERDFAVPFRTSDGIDPPPRADDLEDAAARSRAPWWRFAARDAALDTFAAGARGLLNAMYDDIATDTDADAEGLRPGGEFAAAIAAANAARPPVPVVLGDRDSRATLRRVGELALRGGDPGGLLPRMYAISAETLAPVREAVAAKATAAAAAAADGATPAAGDGEGDDVVNIGTVTEGEEFSMLVEEIKRRGDVRAQLVTRMEAEVPEIARAMLGERDFIMAEAIRRELPASSTDDGAAVPAPAEPGRPLVVGVVGAAHLAGIQRNLERAWQEE